MNHMTPHHTDGAGADKAARLAGTNRGQGHGLKAFALILMVLGLARTELAWTAETPTTPATASGIEDLIAECFRDGHSNPLVAETMARTVLATDQKTPEQHIKILVCLSSVLSTQGKKDEAREASQDALMVFEQSKAEFPAKETAIHLTAIAGSFIAFGDWITALDLANRADALAATLDDPQVQLNTLQLIGRLQLDFQDDPAAAEATIRRAIEISESLRESIPTFYYNLGYILFRLGRLDEAEAAYQRVLRVLERPQSLQPPMRVMRARIQAHQAAIHHQQGKTGNARETLQTIISEQHDIDSAGESVSRALLGKILLDQGAADEALAQAEQALAIAVQANLNKEQLEALSLKAEALSALGRGDEALASLRQAHAIQLSFLRDQNQVGIAHLQDRLRRGEELQRLERDRQIARLTYAGLIIGLLAVLSAVIVQHRTNRRLRDISLIDSLTGLLNRRGMEQTISGLFATGSETSGGDRHLLVLLDIDNFRQVNDQYGHLAGDLVLRSVAQRLLAICGQVYSVARWGGEEFLIAGPCPDLDTAKAFVERLRRAVCSKPVHLPGQEALDITVSIGFVPHPFFPDDRTDPWQASLPLTDQALNSARHAGRDAWVGLWGTPAGRGTPLHFIRQATDRAQVKGWIDVVSSRNLTVFGTDAHHAEALAE